MSSRVNVVPNLSNVENCKAEARERVGAFLYRMDHETLTDWVLDNVDSEVLDKLDR